MLPCGFAQSSGRPCAREWGSCDRGPQTSAPPPPGAGSGWGSPRTPPAPLSAYRGGQGGAGALGGPGARAGDRRGGGPAGQQRSCAPGPLSCEKFPSWWPSSPSPGGPCGEPAGLEAETGYPLDTLSSSALHFFLPVPERRHPRGFERPRSHMR